MLEKYARDMVTLTRSRLPSGVAAAAADRQNMSFEDSPGLGRSDVVDVGSIAKTVTALLLAQSVVRGELSLNSVVGDFFGPVSESVARITLEDLATHRSGLPRLPPQVSSGADVSDPYAELTEGDVEEALLDLAVERGQFTYSNLGYMVLAIALSRATSTSFDDLVQQRVFDPLDLRSATRAIPGVERTACYSGATRVGWWHFNVPGPGGIAMNLMDLMKYLQAHIAPTAEGDLADAIRLALKVRTASPNAVALAWLELPPRRGALSFVRSRKGEPSSTVWHNGGTRGFKSFAALDPTAGIAVGVVSNNGDLASVDAAGGMIMRRALKNFA